MAHETPSQPTAFGYLSTVYTAEHGYFGGYLIVSRLGRPLEFHCTSPVRPSRAHEILYGPTLQAYLLGEQIGGTLLNAAKLTPRLIITDQAAMLAVRPQATVPVTLVLAQASKEQRAEKEAQESPPLRAVVPLPPDVGDALTLSVVSPSDSGLFHFGRHTFDLSPGYEQDRDVALELLGEISEHVDLLEPFGRIHEAIREAQRIGAGDVEIHGQAA